MKQYLYPQNLKATANIWLWSVRDFIILCIATLISLIIAVNTLFLIPGAITLCFAFLTVRLGDMTIIDFIRNAANYLFATQQYFEWR
jgi:maltodextrin utilization protein YvdJ